MQIARRVAQPARKLVKFIGEVDHGLDAVARHRHRIGDVLDMRIHRVGAGGGRAHIAGDFVGRGALLVHGRRDHR